jgi:DNA topoisomerase-1
LKRTSGSDTYTLVICEKPDAARRIAEALSSTDPETFKLGNIQAFRLEGSCGERYVVCAALGHLYGISDTVKDRRVYPALDLEWFPLGEISDTTRKNFISSRIRAIRSLSAKADAFVNACDFDNEGETIGYNILRYACGGKETFATRARFSTLTREDIVSAFESRGSMARHMAMAGRLRHAVDFIWGVNLSRALSESVRTGYSFRTVSIGRVQGPSLNFIVEREIDVRTFVPCPYWTVSGTFAKNGGTPFEAKYSSAPSVLQEKRVAEEVKLSCEERGVGVVSSVSTKSFHERPLPPFNLADLQKEAFRIFGYTPSKTLQVAERLYLGAVISYPRTGSQRLPRIDYRALLANLATISGYKDLVGKVLSSSVLHPVEGHKTDQAHPAIYPTGKPPGRRLTVEETRIFDLILRRFLACFGEDAVREVNIVAISVGAHEFTAEETSTLVPGWRKFMSGWQGSSSSSSSSSSTITFSASEGGGGHGHPKSQSSFAVNTFRQGDIISVKAIQIKERFRARPTRYNQATLLERMEKEEIGTKATRADIISTLLLRGYASGETLLPSELGFSLVEMMREYCPQIISTRLTRSIEAQLERIESSSASGEDFFEETLSVLLSQVSELRRHEDRIGHRIRSSISGDSSASMMILGDCPVCKEGKLRVVRSFKSGKRFVGCTGYARGCRASAPLPQRGVIRATSKPCGSCHWPVISVRLGRYPWKLCVNDRCPRKVNVYAMQKSQGKARKEVP